MSAAVCRTDVRPAPRLRDAGSVTATTPPDNLAVRTTRRYHAALLAHDWNTLADTLAEAFFAEDRRAFMAATRDKSEAIEQARVVAGLGIESVELDVLETRGERFALSRLTYFGNGYEVVSLAVGAVGPDGRMVRATSFDEDDLDAARAELDALAAAET